jgi:hypothetical protein
MLAYEELIIENKAAFISKVILLAGKLNVNPNWLMVVFFIETAASRYGKINSAIQNSIGATGLIQFMPSTAIGLGTTCEALKNMTNVIQLDWVQKYFQPYSGRMKTLHDLYFAVFFPAAIGKADSWILSASHLSAQTIACANPLYDLNKDQQITVAEVKTKLSQFVPLAYKYLL